MNRADPHAALVGHAAAADAEGAPRANPFVHSTGEFLRELSISILIGLGVVFLVLLGESARLTAGTAAYGALIGSFAYIVCLLLGASCGGWIGRIRIVSQRVARSVLGERGHEAHRPRIP